MNKTQCKQTNFDLEIQGQGQFCDRLFARRFISIQIEGVEFINGATDKLFLPPCTYSRVLVHVVGCRAPRYLLGRCASLQRRL